MQLNASPNEKVDEINVDTRRENVTFFQVVSKLLSALNDTKEADHTCIACSIGHLPSALDYRLVAYHAQCAW